MKRAILPLPAGFEEIEAVAIIDLLRRAGVEVLIAGLQPGPVTGAHGLTLSTNAVLGSQRAEDFDLVVLPGGMPGSQTLRDDPRVQALLQTAAATDRWTAAICAAPMAMGAAGLLQGRRFTCYPGFEERCGAGIPQAGPVVVDGRVITANGPGSAIPFALELVRQLLGDGAASDLARQLLLPAP